MQEKEATIDYVRRPDEAARILNISVKTLQRMGENGPQRVRITARIFGYRDSAIKAFLDSRSVAA